MFTTYDLPRARRILSGGMMAAGLLEVPAFLGSGAFRLCEPEPRDPDAPDRERWEDDGGPAFDD